jgi:hypothetical protein
MGFRFLLLFAIERSLEYNPCSSRSSVAETNPNFLYNYPCIVLISFDDILGTFLALTVIVSYLFFQSVAIYGIIYNYVLVTPAVERFNVYGSLSLLMSSWLGRSILNSPKLRPIRLRQYLASILLPNKITMFLYDCLFHAFSSHGLGQPQSPWITFKFSGWNVYNECNVCSMSIESMQRVWLLLQSTMHLTLGKCTRRKIVCFDTNPSLG